MRILALFLLSLSVAPSNSFSQTGSQPPPDWQSIRKLQPDGLQLKLTLPKDHFFQGEEINGKVEFINSSPVPYYLWTGSASRFGRASGIAFFAESTSGQGVIDPLKWASMALQDLGGMGTFKDLGTWDITLPTSYWLRFDQPGTYTLYAWSDRAQAGSQPKPGVQNGPSARVPLVSDKITITIDPLTPEQERQTLAEAKAKLATSADRAEGAVELNALQTSSAREALRPLLNDKDGSGASNAAAMGLMEAPDPRAEAKTLLTDVSEGRLSVCVTMEWTYSWMERYDLPWGTSEEFEQEHKAAFQRIMDAGLKATGGIGPAYVQSLWTQYKSNLLDPKAATYRAALAAHQLELSQENKDEVLRSWFFELRENRRIHPPGYSPTPDWVPRLGGEDFLPLVREALATALPATSSSPTKEEKRARYERQQIKNFALIILANVKPDEARPLIVKDIESEDSSLISGSFPLWGDSDIVPTLPVVPMPELDSALRERLAAPNPYLVPLMGVIDRYGSPNLVPDVLRVYTPEEGRRDSTVRDALIRYLQRSDPSKVDGVSHQ